MHYINGIRSLFTTNDTAMLAYMFWAIVMLVTDIITGWWKSIVTGTSNSDIGTRGLLKHLTIILLLPLFGVVCIVIGDSAIKLWYAVCWSYYILQFQSMLENANVIGSNTTIFEPIIDVIKSYVKNLLK